MQNKRQTQKRKSKRTRKYAKAVLKFAKLNTAAQQREAIVQGRSLLPYRLRYKNFRVLFF
ncbi:MAG: hypothetical protein LBK06_05855 [Planctomycetaceae bacterium]|nr:hypothetical protein [Planctomycetaceae bacterium]